MTKKHSQQLVYVALSIVIFSTLFNIKRVRIINFIFRYLGNFQTKVIISYFGNHKPIVSFLEYDTNDDESEQNLPE